jgi:Mg2+-importing ATPase
MTSLAVVLGAALLPLTPVGSYFGFVAPPAGFYGVLVLVVSAYLVLVEWIKRVFYRRFAG